VKDALGRRISLRHWLAWQLAKLTYRIYPSGEYTSMLSITDDRGDTRLEVGIHSTVWGGGLAWIDTSGLPAGWTWDETEDDE
jgi:hypothetical protein